MDENKEWIEGKDSKWNEGRKALWWRLEGTVVEEGGWSFKGWIGDVEKWIKTERVDRREE